MGGGADVLVGADQLSCVSSWSVNQAVAGFPFLISSSAICALACCGSMLLSRIEWRSSSATVQQSARSSDFNPDRMPAGHCLAGITPAFLFIHSEFPFRRICIYSAKITCLKMDILSCIMQSH
jgi:hypothetical protein